MKLALFLVLVLAESCARHTSDTIHWTQVAVSYCTPRGTQLVCPLPELSSCDDIKPAGLSLVEQHVVGGVGGNVMLVCGWR